MRPSILVISSFPPKGQTHDKKIVGVASYTKNLLTSFPGHKTVLAEKLPGEGSYTEGEIEVKRVWKRGSFLTFFRLFKELRKSKEKIVLFEFEHAMFGGATHLIPLPFFLILNRIAGKKIFFVFHQVVDDIDSLSGHLNLKKNSLKTNILNVMISIFYKMVLLTVSKAIVFEEELKQRLGNSQKIEVIPHGVEKFEAKLDIEQARAKLGFPNNRIVLLCFGFLAWYKGSDLIVDIFSRLPAKIRKNYLLILAGGPNPNHTNKAFYNKYINELKEKAQKNAILVTDFVPEEKIEYYFRASDFVLLPYRTFMSASGPMSLALSFEKPFLISPALKPITKTKDFALSMRESHLSPEDFVFKTLKVLKTGNLKQNLIKFSKVLKSKRYFDKIALNYEKILFQDSGEVAEATYPSLEPELI